MLNLFISKKQLYKECGLWFGFNSADIWIEKKKENFSRRKTHIFIYKKEFVSLQSLYLS